MRRFIFGLALGLFLSSAATYANNYMFGWTVRINTGLGEVTCDDPFMWTSIKEIECDGELN